MAMTVSEPGVIRANIFANADGYINDKTSATASTRYQTFEVLNSRYFLTKYNIDYEAEEAVPDFITAILAIGDINGGFNRVTLNFGR